MKPLRKLIANHLGNKKAYISIGRSRNSAGFGTGTPVEVVPDSDEEPHFVGHPYLKTNFQNKGGFSKILYTPSTLKVVVGKKWIEKNS